MAKAIAHCMSDPEHRAALVRLGAKRAEDFRWSQTARKTLDIYLAAIAARRTAPTVPIETRHDALPESPSQPGAAAR